MRKLSKVEERKVLLRVYTNEWSTLENEKRDYYRKKSIEGDLESTTIQTLYLMQDRIDHLVFQIVKFVDWFISKDEDFDNEVACQIYDKYSSGIHRGLTSLIHHGNF